MNLQLVGRWLLVVGLALALAGGVLWLAGRWFPNLEKLPGTLRAQWGGVTCVVPLLASIVLSLLLTLVLNLLARFLK